MKTFWILQLSKHWFPATITLQPSLLFFDKMVFFSPQGQTNTLTVLPVTVFASSVCQHGNCLSSKQYCETQRHNQSKPFHTYRLDFSLQPIPDLLTDLHPFGNIFSCWTRENTTTLLLRYWKPPYRKHTEHSWVRDFIKGKFLTIKVKPVYYLILDLGNHTRRCIFAQNSGVFWSAGLESPVLKGGTPSASSSAPVSTAGCTPVSPVDASSCQGNYGRCGTSHFTGYSWQRWAFLGSAVIFVSLIKPYTAHDWWDQPLPLILVNIRTVTVSIAVFLMRGPGSLARLLSASSFVATDHVLMKWVQKQGSLTALTTPESPAQVLKALLKKLTLMWSSTFHFNSSKANTSLLSSILMLLRILVPLSTEQTGVKRIKWVLYLLKLSFFSPLVRHVSRCLLIKCWDTLTEHTGHSTAKGHIKANMVINISDSSSKRHISDVLLCCSSCVRPCFIHVG